jgi:hypothetical protein
MCAPEPRDRRYSLPIRQDFLSRTARAASIGRCPGRQGLGWNVRLIRRIHRPTATRRCQWLFAQEGNCARLLSASPWPNWSCAFAKNTSLFADRGWTTKEHASPLLPRLPGFFARRERRPIRGRLSSVRVAHACESRSGRRRRPWKGPDLRRWTSLPLSCSYA